MRAVTHPELAERAEPWRECEYQITQIMLVSPSLVRLRAYLRSSKQIRSLLAE